MYQLDPLLQMFIDLLPGFVRGQWVDNDTGLEPVLHVECVFVARPPIQEIQIEFVLGGESCGSRCECGSVNTVQTGFGAGSQDADPSRNLPMMETDGLVYCKDCGREWWD